jgi:hypothetical protein
MQWMAEQLSIRPLIGPAAAGEPTADWPSRKSSY